MLSVTWPKHRLALNVFPCMIFFESRERENDVMMISEEGVLAMMSWDKYSYAMQMVGILTY